MLHGVDPLVEEAVNSPKGIMFIKYVDASTYVKDA